MLDPRWPNDHVVTVLITSPNNYHHHRQVFEYLSGTTPPDLIMGASVMSVVSGSNITSSGMVT